MAIVTFLSDFGIKDHYVAAVKAKILSINPSIQVVDISHQVPLGDLAYGSFLLRSVYKDFPQGTVHLIAVDDPQNVPSEMIAVKAENHYFVGADNGLIGLVTDSQNYIVSKLPLPGMPSSFPCKDILAPAAARLASGNEVADVGNAKDQFKKMINRHLRATKAQIVGSVIHVDHYGNLITNIDRTTFDQISQDRPFNLNFGREKAQKIHDGYYSVEPGDSFVFFNSQNLLEIGIKQGKASSLLNLNYDSPVIINFIV